MRPWNKIRGRNEEESGQSTAYGPRSGQKTRQVGIVNKRDKEWVMGTNFQRKKINMAIERRCSTLSNLYYCPSRSAHGGWRSIGGVSNIRETRRILCRGLRGFEALLARNVCGGAVGALEVLDWRVHGEPDGIWEMRIGAWEPFLGY